MAGLIHGAMQDGPPSGAQDPMEQAAMAQSENGMPQNDQDDPGTVTGDLPGTEAPTDEEQLQYYQIMIGGLEILYGDETYPGIVELMRSSASSPELALAAVAVLVITQIDEAAQGSIPLEMILLPVGEVVEQASEIANKEQLFSKPVDEAMMNRAAQEALLQLAKQYEIDPADLQDLLDNVEKVAPGTLESVRAAQEAMVTVEPERQAKPPTAAGARAQQPGQPTVGAQ